MNEQEIVKKLNKVAVFGPHDRMNYGDFLFPIMLDYAFSKQLGNKIVLKKYSLINADFSDVGAFNSSSFNHLKKDVVSKEIDTIIIAGGESMGATWSRLLSFIYPWFLKIYLARGFSKISKFVDYIIRLFFKHCYEYPFVVDKDYFPNVKLIYNSVGGLDKKISGQIIGRLNKANYLALREEHSYQNASVLGLKNAVLAPDSAIIMSDVYKFELFSRSIENNYIFFQISKYKAKFPLEEIVLELQKILDSSRYDIVLCPIGIALGHEDDIILKDIYTKFFNNNSRVHLVENITIEKIMGLIANSKLYIGTSLHGVITAMSYNVPYIGLNPAQTKVVNYISTWGLRNVLKVCQTNDFYEQFLVIIKQEIEIRSKSETLLIQHKDAYYKSVNRILNIILK